MGTKRLAALLVTAAAIFTGTAASAATFMPEGDRTTQPIGHYELCKRLPSECGQKTRGAAPVELTRKLWAELIDINNAVNTVISPRTDLEIWGVEEVWSYPENGIGDCEDYVLEKRRRIMALGVQPGNLLITVVRQANGDGHAILTIRTSLGDFVLDNLEPKILAWGNTEYQFLKRQSERNSGQWVSINDSRNVAVGSVSQ